MDFNHCLSGLFPPPFISIAFIKCHYLFWLFNSRKIVAQKQVSLNQEKAVLIGVISQNQSIETANEYLEELAFLAQTAGANTINRFLQKLPHPDAKTYVGK